MTRQAATAHLTQLLQAWSAGDQDALRELSTLVESELRRLARRYLAREQPGHTLQPTALINEVWVRLIDWRNASWQNRAHFFAVSAQLMRHTLVDYARRHPQLRGARVEALDAALQVASEPACDIVALDEALDRLASIDSRKSRIVEMRFFGGLKEDEIAAVLDLSSKTVQREWIKAKAWLYRELGGAG